MTIAQSQNNTLSFLRNKHLEYIQGYGADNIKMYIDFYEQFGNQQLREIFSIIHYNLNNLFKYMNGRIRNGRYTAGESRQLIYLIEEIKVLRANLKDTDFDFEIAEHYEAKIVECDGFLENSNGSIMPPGFQKIIIIEAEPVFIPKTVHSIKRGNRAEAFSLQMVGAGSYATVYKYKDDYYDRYFSLKRAKKNLSAKELQRFKTEFDVMKRLNSPYVIEVYTYDNYKHEYIMEFADETLQEYITNKKSSVGMSERLGLVRQILRAFIYINSKGVLHRDISATNILLKNYEGLSVVKVSDFGLVKQKDSTLTSRKTEIKGVLNDPKLDIIGFQNYEIRHETYALTRLIYFVITGKSRIELLKSSDLSLFVQKGISDNIEERYKDVEELQSAFNKTSRNL